VRLAADPRLDESHRALLAALHASHTEAVRGAQTDTPEGWLRRTRSGLALDDARLELDALRGVQVCA
jgi:hypothetical protein